ncbi:hypothetical protein NIES2111_17100 [Nostoc sp. NIES-2111]|nr:hypothetical protein NIES2111_17100 [Nostoc sp. NIES-2111]
MAIDLREFFKATDPSRTLFINNILDSKCYIDFSSVRGGDIIQTLKKRITFFSQMNLPAPYLLDISAVGNLGN